MGKERKVVGHAYTHLGPYDLYAPDRKYDDSPDDELEQALVEYYPSAKGLKRGILVVKESDYKNKLMGVKFNLRDASFKVENKKQFEWLEKNWSILPVDNITYEAIPTSKVVPYDKLFKMYWEKFPKSDTIWSAIDYGQPFIRDFAFATGTLFADPEFRNLLAIVGTSPNLKRKEQQIDKLVTYSRKKMYNWLSDGGYSKMVHNPSLLWQIVTNTLSSPSFWGAATPYKAISVYAGNKVTKLPMVKSLGEFIAKRLPHKLLHLFSTVEDYSRDEVTHKVLNEISPFLGSDSAKALYVRGFGKVSAEAIQKARKAIGEIFDTTASTLQQQWNALSPEMTFKLVNFWKTGKGFTQLDDLARAFDTTTKETLKQLPARFVLKPDLVLKVSKLFNDITNPIPEALKPVAWIAKSYLKVAKTEPYFEKYLKKAIAESVRKNLPESAAKSPEVVKQIAIQTKKVFGDIAKNFTNPESFAHRVSQEIPLRNKFINEVKKQFPVITRKMRAKFRAPRQIGKKSFGTKLLTEKDFVKTLSGLDASQLNRTVVKELRKANYIPHKVAQVKADLARLTNPKGFWNKAQLNKDWNPLSPDEAFHGVLSRIILPKIIPYQRLITHHIKKLSKEAMETIPDVLKDNVRKAIEASKGASLLTPAKKAGIFNAVHSKYIDAVLAGRIGAYSTLNMADDGARMLTSVVESLAKGERPASNWVARWAKVNVPEKVFGKGWAASMKSGDVVKTFSYDNIRNNILHYGAEIFENGRASILYKYHFLARSDALKRAGVPATKAMKLGAQWGKSQKDTYLFDYSKVLLFDQMVGPAAPFIKFYRNNARLLLDKAVNSPWLINSLAKVYRTMDEWEEDKMPPHLQGWHKSFKNTYVNFEWLFSWSPVFKLLSNMDRNSFEQMKSSDERKYERYLTHSDEFQEDMIAKDPSFGAYVRSRGLSGVSKVLSLVSDVVPLVPWFTLPADVLGIKEPELRRAVLPQTDLIFNLTGLSLEPWLKDDREKKIKSRTTIEMVGQAMKGETVDRVEAEKIARSGILINSIKKLAVGGWIGNINDWEIELYNGIGKIFEKEEYVFEPTTEQLKKIMDEHDTGPDYAREIFLNKQIALSGKAGKDYTEFLLDHLPFVKTFFNLKDIDKRVTYEKEMKAEQERQIQLIDGAPNPLKDVFYKQLGLIRGLTLDRYDDITKTVIKKFSDVNPVQWFDTINGLSEDLTEKLREIAPEWLKNINKALDDALKSPDPPDALPGLILAKKETDDLPIWKKLINSINNGLAPDQVWAAEIKDNIPRVKTPEQQQAYKIIKQRAEKKYNDINSLPWHAWNLSKEDSDLVYNKTQDMWREFKRSDPNAYNVYKVIYEENFREMENLMKGIKPYESVPVDIRSETPEFQDTWNSFWNLPQDIIKEDDTRSQQMGNVREAFLTAYEKARNVPIGHPPKPFYQVGLDSNKPNTRRMFKDFEDMFAGKMDYYALSEEARQRGTTMEYAARQAWNSMRGNKDVINNTYETNRPLFDAVMEYVSEARPAVEQMKWDAVLDGYQTFVRSYNYDPDILDEVPEEIRNLLASRDPYYAKAAIDSGYPITTPKTIEDIESIRKIPYSPLEPGVEQGFISNTPIRPSTEAFSNIVSLMDYGRKNADRIALALGRKATIAEASRESIKAIGREFKTDPMAFATMWPLTRGTVEIGIAAGAFPKENVDNVREALDVTSSVVAGAVTGFKVGGFLTTAAMAAPGTVAAEVAGHAAAAGAGAGAGGGALSALATPLSAVIGALLFGFASIGGLRSRAKQKRHYKAENVQRQAAYDARQKEQELYYAAQERKYAAQAAAQVEKTRKLSGEMYRESLNQWQKAGSQSSYLKQQPNWFRQRFAKDFPKAEKGYKAPQYRDKVGLVRTIERSLPKPKW